MRIDFFAKTDVGRVRKENQDYFGYLEESGFFIVCDGMGGGAAGDFASRAAVEVALKAFEKLSIDEISEVLGDSAKGVPGEALRTLACIRLANRALFNFSDKFHRLSGMGTTIVAVLYNKDTNILHMFHVGDSRVYRLRRGLLDQLTKDHSKVTELIEQGKMREEDVKTAEIQSMITRALGIHEKVKIDYRAEFVLPDDNIMLCSDGLVSELEDGDIKDIMLANKDSVRESTERLISSANEAGGKDNDTVITMRFLPDDKAQAASQYSGDMVGNVVTVPEETQKQSAVEDKILKSIISAARVKVPKSAREKSIISNPLYLGSALALIIFAVVLSLSKLGTKQPDTELLDLTGKVAGIALEVRAPKKEYISAFKAAEDRIDRLEMIQDWYSKKDELTVPMKNVTVIIKQGGVEKLRVNTNGKDFIEIKLNSGSYEFVVEYDGYKVVKDSLEFKESVGINVEMSDVLKPILLVMLPE